ncbi:hypothetical protein AQUCO_01000353v1 [Aquilegia coerulea]|uniref:Uncharacterized protein n=1 Tax=Aquilegia coerulea TaxID=218851 RepID=A0A2G5E9I6_AQUCA|nr:hypothetical protein AQUCO_01000353v1 [Aquilegia coerulea]
MESPTSSNIPILSSRIFKPAPSFSLFFILRIKINMSALIDIWTSELAKMREKGETLFPSGSKNPATGAEVKSKSSIFARLFEFKAGSEVVYSEATISMILECISP